MKALVEDELSPLYDVNKPAEISFPAHDLTSNGLDRCEMKYKGLECTSSQLIEELQGTKKCQLIL